MTLLLPKTLSSLPSGHLIHLHDFFLDQTQTHQDMDCPDQEGRHRRCCFAQKPTGLMCWGQRGYHHLESQAHTSTYMPRIVLIYSVTASKELLFSCSIPRAQSDSGNVAVPGLEGSSLGLRGPCFLKDSPGEPREESGLWPCLQWRCLIMARWDGWSVVLASPGSKVDQKAWVLFSSLTFAIVQYWQGFPLQGLSFHVDKVRVLD